MKIKKEFLMREVAGEYFLAPIGKTVYDYNGLLSLSEVGAFIWERLPEAENEDAILAAILETYDIDAETARKDMDEFLGELREMDIL